MSKLAFVAAVATLLAFAPGTEVKAQKGIGITVKDGITFKDTRKAKLEAGTYLNEGDKYRVLQKYDEAVKNYLKALKAYPNDADIYKNLGGTYAQMGKLPEAEATLKQGTRLFPKEWLMWNNLAVVYLNLGKTEQCKEALKACLALNPPADKVEQMKTTLNALTSTKGTTTSTTTTTKTKTSATKTQ